jgi:hypothetical protein
MRWAVTVPAGPSSAKEFRARAEATLAEFKKQRTSPIAPPHGGWAATGQPEPKPDGWTPGDEKQAAAAVEAAVALAAAVGGNVRVVLRGDPQEHVAQDHDQAHIAVEVYFAPTR